MVEGLIGQGDVEEYWRLGGKLNEDSFAKARCVLSDLAKGKKPRVRNSSLAQVENMARFSKISITPEQRYLYAVLREMTGKTDRRPDSPQGTMPVWALADQCLLAEVLLLTGEMAKCDSFISVYPLLKKQSS